LPKSREFRTLRLVLNLFIITIVFTILSLRERELVYVFNIIFIADRRKRYKINKGILVKK